MYRIYAIITLSVLLFLALGAGGWLYSRWRAEVKEKEAVISFNGKTVEQLETYKSVNGKLVTVNESLAMDNSTIKQLHKEGQLEILNEFKNLKASYRNLENLVQTKLEVSDNIKFKVWDKQLLTDSTKTNTLHTGTTETNSKWFTYAGPYITLTGTYKNDSANVDYKVTVPLSVVVYWDRKWFLGKKQYNVEAVSLNKNAVIQELKSVQVRRKK